MSRRFVFLGVAALSLVPLAGNAQNPTSQRPVPPTSQYSRQGSWTDADRQALRQAWLNHDDAEVRRLQHKAWDSGHQDEIRAFQTQMFRQQNQTDPKKTLDKAVVMLACSRKMIAFSGTPEYDRAVNACVAKELPTYARARDVQRNARQQQLRNEYGISPPERN